jgi:hypothetical protein
MKPGLFLTAALFSITFSAYAQETTPAADSQATELEKFSYIPAEGNAILNLGFEHETQKGNVKGPAGTVSDFKLTQTDFNYGFGFGVSNYLLVGLQGRVLMTSQTDYDYGPGSTLNGTSATYKKSGWEEPEIGAIWRVRDNTATKMRMNITGAVTPKIQTAKSSTKNSNGNGGVGGTRFHLGLGFFKEVKDTELQFKVQRTLQTVEKFENADDSTQTRESDDHQVTTITLGMQGFASDELTIGGNLVFQMGEKYSDSYYTNSTKTLTVDYDSSNSST